jgi:hypothetical protein
MTRFAPHIGTADGPIAQPVRPRCHLLPTPTYRQEMRQRFQAWQEITIALIAA